MGNCFPNLKKDNKIGPAPAAKSKKDVHEILSEGTKLRRRSPREPADMAKALNEEGADLPLKKQNVAFTVDLDKAKSSSKMPSHIAQRLEGEKDKENDIEYTTEEEILMAEILRDSMMKERKEKAGRVDIKIYDAKRRRMCVEYCKAQEMKLEAGRSTSDVAERRKRVKEMADESRKAAAAERRAKEGE